MKYIGKGEAIINEAGHSYGQAPQMISISETGGVIFFYIKRILVNIIKLFFTLFFWSLLLIIILSPIIGFVFVIYRFFFSSLI